jgi:orotate phosphoribosyltransferase
MKAGTLWVPQRIANTMVQNGFGKAVVECLERIHRLPKSATSKASDRPKAIDHYNSFGIQKILSEEPKEILLVDDVITRGATMLGAANRLKMILESKEYAIAINQRFDKLITSLRTAVESGEGVLDKQTTSFNDIFDAFRLALNFYK